MISLRHVLVPTSIQVFNIGSITTDSIQLYFEHTRTSGGGDIKQFTMSKQHRYAIVEFCDTQGQYSLSVVAEFKIILVKHVLMITITH